MCLSTRSRLATVAAGVVVGFTGHAGAVTVLLDQHVDVAVDYQPAGGWRMVWNDKDTPGVYLPAEAVAQVDLSAARVRPAGAAWDFVGVPAGATFYEFPQSQAGGLPYIGVGAESIGPGVFNGDVRLTLVSAGGPGFFSLYQQTGFGTVTSFMSSADGISADDRLAVSPGSHTHYGWGFTQPGVYDLTFQPSGTLANGSPSTGGLYTFRFAVVPEPAALSLLAGGLALLRRRR